MTDINAATGTSTPPQVHNGQARFHQAMENVKSAGAKTGKVAAEIGKLALNRLSHPDAGVVGAAFNFKGNKILLAALPSVKALKSGNLENTLQNTTYFMAMTLPDGSVHIFTGNPANGIVEVGKPNFATKPFDTAGMKGVIFSNSRTGGTMNGGAQITASVNSGVLLSDIAPNIRSRIKKGISKAAGKIIQKMVENMLEKVRNDKFEPHAAKDLRGFITKNGLEYFAKKPVSDYLITKASENSGKAIANAINNSANFMIGAAWRDDVRINENHTVSLHGGVNTTVDFSTLRKAMDDILK